MTLTITKYYGYYCYTRPRLPCPWQIGSPKKLANMCAAAAYLNVEVEVRNHLSCLTRRSRFGPDGMPCVVLWRPEALDCRMLPSRGLEWTYP